MVAFEAGLIFLDIHLLNANAHLAQHVYGPMPWMSICNTTMFSSDQRLVSSTVAYIGIRQGASVGVPGQQG